MTEREFEGEKIPEPLGIHQTDLKTYRQINDEIRAAQSHKGKKLGSLGNMTWINYIPGFLMKRFVCISDRNIRMAKRYGKTAVTSVGMFTKEPVWFIPHGTATVMLTVSSITKKMIFDGTEHKERELLCLTTSFDHNIIDGVPAARFMNQLIESIRSGSLLHNILPEVD
jgi:hypothetical protein